MKFLPTYRLSVEIGETPVTPGGDDSVTPQTGNVTITLPFTCDFTIDRASASSSQRGTFRLHNLEKQTRDRIQKDWFTTADIRAIQFFAGYENEALPLLFNGTVKSAQSSRQGEDDITEIEAWDGASAMANGYTLRSIAGGAVFSDLIKTLASDLPGITGAIVGQFTGKTKRGAVFAGNTWNYILQLSNGLAIVDNNQVKALNQNEVIQAEIPVITSSSGMLETPRRFGGMIQVEILFEPRLIVGQIVQLNSTVNSIYNGAYKVMGFTHRGIISTTVDGQRITTVTLWSGINNAAGFVYTDGSSAP